MCEKLSKEGGGIDMLSKQPPDCMAAIISFTGPRDTCQLATISTSFKSAANSDEVWINFLPPNISDILLNSDELSIFLTNKLDNASDFVHSISKRDLFFLLFHRPPLLIDDGTKSVSLERLTGKKCCSISARDLDITWGDTPKYWQWHSISESRFSEVAELINSTYGFTSPVEVSIKIDGKKTKKRNVYLDEEVRNRRLIIVPRRRRVFHGIRPHTRTLFQPTIKQCDVDEKEFPRKRDDGWMEVEVGEFFVRKRSGSDQDWEFVEMSLLEIDSGNWKGGLGVHGFDITPKVFTNM